MNKKTKNSSSTRTKWKSERKDYRKGGRVGYKEGNVIMKDQSNGEFEAVQANKAKDTTKNSNTTNTTNTTDTTNTTNTTNTTADTNAPTGDTSRTDTTISTPLSQSTGTALSPAAREREFRVSESAKRQEQIATGKVDLASMGLEAQAAQVDTNIPADQKIAGKDAFVDSTGTPLKSTDYKADAGGVEAVTEGTTAADVIAPTDLKASTIEDVSTISKSPELEAAQGKVREESLSEATTVDRVDAIEGAKVEIIPGALTDRVIGVLSPESKATAAINAGSTLAKVTRAKKQLSNAGLSDTDIAELGNDPEALEARLMDFSEEQRGVIAGLPEEALVSNQLDSLLKGIEEGEIPTWARPAVASVEAMLAQRGMSASTVGRDALFNAIIQSAVPLAQANAQAIQASVGQQKSIEAQEAESNAARAQQTGMQNAQSVFQMNMAQFSSDQQIALSNSKFLQTVGITEANFNQQAVVQNAMLLSQANLADADFSQKAQIQNAQAFLQTDLTNLSNQQQSNLLKAQQEQQILLSNQSAVNAAKQFNATSENQTQQFMTNLSAQINMSNAQRKDSMEQFNAVQNNQAEARLAQRTTDVSKFNAQLAASVDQYNGQQEFAREQFNAQNALVIEQSNVQWRREITKVNTAAQQQVNMVNAQAAYGLTTQAQTALWQEVRDEFDYIWKSSENAANRETNIAVAAMAGEHSALKNSSNMARLEGFLRVFDPTT
jgi:hypothetical protein